MSVQAESHQILQGRSLAWARLTWVLVALLLFGIVLASWPPYMRLLLMVCDGCPLTPAYAESLQAVGISPTSWAIFLIIPTFLVYTGWMGMGIVIFLFKSNDRRALLLSALLLLVGASFGGTIGFNSLYLPEWLWLSNLINTLSFPAMVALIYLFPNGLFKPRWLALLLIIQTLLFLPIQFENLGWPIAYSFIVILSIVISCIAVPLYRYRRVMSFTERQQTKWVLLGIVLAMVGIAITIAVTLLLTATGLATTIASDSCATRNLYCDVVQNVGYSFSPLMIPIFIGIAILRSRLWDIDIIIRRTLQYLLLTGLLALTYFGLVVLLQNLFSRNQKSEVVNVLSTLAVAALFIPLRRRVQAAVDGRFYRKKYSAQQILDQFAHTARDETGMDRLAAALVQVVAETVQPERVSLWLKPTADGRRRTQW